LFSVRYPKQVLFQVLFHQITNIKFSNEMVVFLSSKQIAMRELLCFSLCGFRMSSGLCVLLSSDNIKFSNETGFGMFVFLFSILRIKLQIDFMLQPSRVQLVQWLLLSSWLPSPPPGPSDRPQVEGLGWPCPQPRRSPSHPCPSLSPSLSP